MTLHPQVPKQTSRGSSGTLGRIRLNNRTMLDTLAATFAGRHPEAVAANRRAFNRGAKEIEILGKLGRIEGDHERLGPRVPHDLAADDGRNHESVRYDDENLGVAQLRSVSNDLVERHVGESFEGAALLDRHASGRLLDLGSGTGYPALPIAAFAADQVGGSNAASSRAQGRPL